MYFAEWNTLENILHCSAPLCWRAALTGWNISSKAWTDNSTKQSQDIWNADGRKNLCDFSGFDPAVEMLWSTYAMYCDGIVSCCDMENMRPLQRWQLSFLYIAISMSSFCTQDLLHSETATSLDPLNKSTVTGSGGTGFPTQVLIPQATLLIQGTEIKWNNFHFIQNMAKYIKTWLSHQENMHKPIIPNNHISQDYFWYIWKWWIKPGLLVIESNRERLEPQSEASFLWSEWSSDQMGSSYHSAEIKALLSSPQALSVTYV